jgi:phospholipase C
MLGFPGIREHAAAPFTSDTALGGSVSVARLLVLAFLGLIVSAGCSSSGGTPVVLTRELPHSESPHRSISHVVVIIQENRSFENFFTGYPGANAPASGCAIPEKNARLGITRRVVRRDSLSVCPSGDISVALKPITFNSLDLPHDWQSSMVSWH